MSLSKKYTLFALLGLVVYLHSSCEKAIISPQNQSLAFIKYYGHVSGQTGSDLKRTADGGYIMVGSTNSYTTEKESDVFVVKTDALGNEEWSTSMGKLAGWIPAAPVVTLSGKYIRYDEKGIDLVILPDDAGYAIACNRTYVEYASASGTEKVKDWQTKVVLYQLDLAGVNITPDANPENGIELRSTSDFTDKVSDMKLDTTNGLIRYVMTGYTTDIAVGKPIDGHNGAYDFTDIFTILVDESFNPVLSWIGNVAYGFTGQDYGTSVQVLSDGYLVTGTTEYEWNPPTADFEPRIIVVRMKKSNGAPLDPEYFGTEAYHLEGGHSVYDAANNRVTIAGAVIGGVNIYTGHMLLFQVDESISITTPSPDADGFRFYRPTSPSQIPPATDNTYHAEGIDILPDNSGFVISMTHKKNNLEHNIAIMKVDGNFDQVSGWPYYFGYESSEAAFSTQEKAGAVIAVTEGIANTSQVELKGYAFTGTFGLGTSSGGTNSNNMMGLVKLDVSGDFNPQ